MKLRSPRDMFRILETLLNPRYRASMQDGLLRLRLTDRCNARCWFCNHWRVRKDAQLTDMTTEFLYSICTPLYKKIKLLLLTGGEPIVHPECYNLVKFIGKRFPRITIFFETNGIGFDERWQELAADELLYVLCSMNAPNAESFQKGCAHGPGGEKIFEKILGNMTAYRDLLKSKGLEEFGPRVSMVINKDNAGDVEEFVALALKLRARGCGFYFERSESRIEDDHFGSPETSRPALRKLIEMERVLAGRFQFTFRLWLPLQELPPLQAEVDALPLEQLQREYQHLLELSEGRSIDQEHAKRQAIAERKGRKPLTIAEELYPALREMEVGGQTICFAPFKELDIFPDGRVECCGWIWPFRMRLDKYQSEDGINWNRLFNSYLMKLTRKRMLNGDYRSCMKCCPLNPTYKPKSTVPQHGYDRLKTGNL